MKYKILLPLLFASISLNAQQKRTTAFAITSAQQGQFVWTEVKLIDLQSGEVLRQVYESNRDQYNIFTARDGKPVKVKNEAGQITDQQKMPFSTFSAACAFDKKHNRLYYTPMFINQLRYIDLAAKSPSVFYFEGEEFSKAASLNNEANHITRMVIGADGNGYALSNDGNHLVKFTTGKKPVITDMGALQDDPANNNISIHNRCTSWGGDMIASADGSLYVVSANHSVFQVDVRSRIAKFISTIEGLPSGFTSNGAAIDDRGALVLSSANSTDGYYSVDMRNWKAEKIAGIGKVFNTSDLANGNLAFDREQKADRTPVLTRIPAAPNGISIYPNPVTDRLFRVTFNTEQSGRYSVQVVDLTGRMLQENIVTVAGKGQVVEIGLQNALARGVYMVKVLSNLKKTVHTDKILVD